MIRIAVLFQIGSQLPMSQELLAIGSLVKNTQSLRLLRKILVGLGIQEQSQIHIFRNHIWIIQGHVNHRQNHWKYMVGMGEERATSSLGLVVEKHSLEVNLTYRKKIVVCSSIFFQSYEPKMAG
jgi:hypothetical protein